MPTNVRVGKVVQLRVPAEDLDGLRERHPEFKDCVRYGKNGKHHVVFGGEQEKLVRDQSWLAHKYRNQLVEIERERRKAYRAIRAALSPDLEAMEAAHLQLEEEQREARERFRAMKSATFQKENQKSRDRSYDQAQEEVMDSIEARRVQDLKAKSKASYERLRAKRFAVAKEFFGEADEEFKKLKEERLAALVKKTGKVPGPRSKEREDLIDSLMKEMIDSDRWPEAWKEKTRAEIAAREKIAKARNLCKCFSGVYQAVESAAKQSFEDSVFEPRFEQFDGTGRVGIQVTGKVSVKDALREGGASRIWIEMLSESQRPIADREAVPLDWGRKKYPIEADRKAAWKARQKKHLADGEALSEDDRQSKFRERSAIARIYLGGRSKAEKKYLAVPFLLHRPLPEDGVIKWVYLDVKKVGLRTVYEIQFTIESDEFHAPAAVNDRALAVHVGWRVKEDGDVRVATTWDGEKFDEVLLPASLHEIRKYAVRLLGHADNHFNDAREILKKHLAENPKILSKKDREDLHADSIAQWRGHGRLAKVAIVLRDRLLDDAKIRDLWEAWKKDRICVKPDGIAWATWHPNGKKDLFDTFESLSAWFEQQGIHDPIKRLALYLEWWRRKGKHLLDTARASNQMFLRKRREEYRKAARRWANRYGYVIIDKWNKGEMAKKPKPEDGTRSKQEENASSVRQDCGVYALESEAKQAFGKRRVIEMPSEDVADTHHGCGCSLQYTVEHWKAQCVKTGRLEDQDQNRVLNVYEACRERSPAVAA